MPGRKSVFVKGRLLGCKRLPFARQKVTYCVIKGNLLHFNGKPAVPYSFCFEYGGVLLYDVITCVPGFYVLLPGEAPHALAMPVCACPVGCCWRCESAESRLFFVYLR